MEARIVEGPEEYPAVDYLTGSAVGPFIDTGVYAVNRETGRRFGRIYLSESTVRYLNSLFDADPVAQAERRNRDYAEGVLDGTRDVIGPDLVRVADSLRRFLDRVAPVEPPEDPEQSDGVAV